MRRRSKEREALSVSYVRRSEFDHDRVSVTIDDLRITLVAIRNRKPIFNRLRGEESDTEREESTCDAVLHLSLCCSTCFVSSII